MTKVMVINGLWATLICGMLASSFILYHQPTDDLSAYNYAHENLASR